MGQARQRQLQAINGEQPTPKPEMPTVYGLVEGQQIEQQQPDGTIVRIPIFHPVDEKGGVRCVKRQDGSLVPIAFAGLPVPVGRGLIVAAGPLAKG